MTTDTIVYGDIDAADREVPEASAEAIADGRGVDVGDEAGTEAHPGGDAGAMSGEGGDGDAEAEAAEEKAARKAAKKQRAAEKAARKAAKRQRADQEAARRAADAIRAIVDGGTMNDREAVAAARKACDRLTRAQEKLIPEDLLSMLAAVERLIGETAESFPIEACAITVKDAPYTGQKIKRPSVKVECGDLKLRKGRDYAVSCDRKIRDIGRYALMVRGKGRFTGSADVPFYVVPRAGALIQRMGGDPSALDWARMKGVAGCQIQYGLDKNLSDGAKEKIRKPEDLARLAGKLNAGEKYYLRVRVFTRVKGKKLYSAWSKVKAVKI